LVVGHWARRIFKQIRSTLADDIVMEGSSVELDETYVGGKDVNRHESKRSHQRGRGARGKTIVFGMVQRKGSVVARVVPNVEAATLLPVVREKVLDRTVGYTDEMPSHNRLGRMGYDHRHGHHASKVYVMGDAHTNTMEGLWPFVKRGLSGVNHAVSAKYLQDYFNEYGSRYNRRGDERPMFEAFLDRMIASARGA
jgi:transposase-like protein